MLAFSSKPNPKALVLGKADHVSLFDRFKSKYAGKILWSKVEVDCVASKNILQQEFILEIEYRYKGGF